MEQVRADFDRIAVLSTDNSDGGHFYGRFLLRNVPEHSVDCLDIGCGTGAFTRRLAWRCKNVLALDLSPKMIEIARSRAAEFSNIEFRVADVLMTELPKDRFDVIVSIATLHHLPIDEMLGKMAQWLRPGGRLIILDLFEQHGPWEWITSALAVPIAAGLRLVRQGRLRESGEVRQAWAEHSRNDRFPTMSQVRRICAARLPGATVRRHLLWRYSIIWKKPLDIGTEGQSGPELADFS